MLCLAVQVESGRGYNLDTSFFERLVNQGHPVVTLQQQRRMRPTISSLIRPIYPHLQVILHLLLCQHVAPLCRSVRRVVLLRCCPIPSASA